MSQDATSPLDVHEPGYRHHQLAFFAALALVGGVLTGLLGGVFRWCLSRTVEGMTSLIEWAHGFGWIGIAIPIAVSTCGVVLARLIVVAVPEAAGSGIQRVEAAMRGQTTLESIRLVPAKFVGGLLAIGSGLALGREGPLVQMGAAIGATIGKIAKLPKSLCFSLEGAMAGAGLAAAFNAPIAGAVFVFEELTSTFRMRVLVPTLAATGAAVATLRTLFGDLPDFSFDSVVQLDALQLGAYIVFGCIVGLLGAAYNKTLVWCINVVEQIKVLPVLVKAGLVGALVGGIAWFWPNLVGGGDQIAQEMLTGSPVLLAVLGILVLRWVLGPLSYSIGTPGGLFAPLLAVGATLGMIFATAASFGTDLFNGNQFAFVGMAAFFAAVVRAPLTAVILIAEMTTTMTLLIPSMFACTAAVVVTMSIKSEPIYDTLRHRMLRGQSAPRAAHVPNQ